MAAFSPGVPWLDPWFLRMPWTMKHTAVAETRPEHFDRVLADGKVSTRVCPRRIHNHALGIHWLLKSAMPRLQ